VPYFLQLSKIESRSNFFRELRSRRNAVPVWSRHCDKLGTNKKPGNKRRASPSILWGCLYPRSLQNGYARSSIVWYPVLVSNLTSCRVGRSGSSGDFPTNQGSANIKGVYQIFGIRQAVFTIYLCGEMEEPVDFTDLCGNCFNLVQVRSSKF
jgi:hypothetical protein